MNRSEHGFSLVEMLAALAVLSIAGMALMNAMTTSTRAASLTSDAALAQIAAQNVLSTLLLEADRSQALRPADGEYALAERRFAWRLEVEPSGQPGLNRLRLVIEDAQTGRELQSLETLRRSQ